MVNLSRVKLLSLAGLAAVASVAAVAMPTQAAPASNTEALPPPANDQATTKVDSGQPQALAVRWNSTSAYQTVRNNPLYKTPALPRVNCPELKISFSTATGVRRYVQRIVDCSYVAWAPVLKAARKPYKPKPTVIVYGTTSYNTPCGRVYNTRTNYCGYKNGYIYVPWVEYYKRVKQNNIYGRAYATNTIAHEYGHHIQYVTNILDASWWRQRAIRTSTGKLEENRRRELQASCLGSAFLGSAKRSYPMSGKMYTNWKWLVEHSGDQPGSQRTHGSPKNHGWWSHTGFYASSSVTYAGRCNTWNAASSRVS